MKTFSKIIDFANREIAQYSGVYTWGICIPSENEIKSIADFVYSLSIRELIYYNLPSESNVPIRPNETFFPLNVGEATKRTVAERIQDHFTKEAFYNSVLFNLQYPLVDLINAIFLYNQFWVSPKLYKTHPGVNRLKRLSKLAGDVNTKTNYLLFFSNPDYYRQIFPGIALPTNFLYEENVSQTFVMLSLCNKHAGVIDYKRNLLISQILLKRFFRFTYCKINPDGNNNINKYEAATKYVLSSMGLHTMAHVHKDGKVYEKLFNGVCPKPLQDVIDFHTNLLGEIHNPLGKTLLRFDV